LQPDAPGVGSRAEISPGARQMARFAPAGGDLVPVG
jgi:hypothetical protein